MNLNRNGEILLLRASTACFEISVVHPVVRPLVRPVVLPMVRPAVCPLVRPVVRLRVRPYGSHYVCIVSNVC